MVFGKVGEDPINGWNDDPTSTPPFTAGPSFWLSWTKDHTLKRKSSVTDGVTNNPLSFNVSTEWDSLPSNTWNYLGSHNCDCHAANIDDKTKENAVIYPNPILKEEFYISTSSEIKEVLIYTLLGDLVLRKDSIDTTSLVISSFKQPSGVYFVRIVFTNGYNVIEKIEVN